MKLTEPAIIDSRVEETRILTGFLRNQAACASPLKILEAGCGRGWPFDLKETPHTLVGVDVRKEALEARMGGSGDLHEAIVADLRELSLPPAEFDVIYCCFVLEHIAGAEQVLDSFLEWLKPGGIVILKIPDRDSVYGFFTRITPFWMHVFWKKYLRRSRYVDVPGARPVPTVYDRVVSRRGIREYCLRNGVGIEAEYGTAFHFNRPGVVPRLECRVGSAVGFLSCGRLASRYTNLTYVLRRNEARPGTGNG